MSLEEKINANVQKTVDQVEELIFQPLIVNRLSPQSRAVLSEVILLCIKNTLKAIAED